MRIKSISASNILPVQKFSVDNLSDLVVIAGPNGVGKTRLVNRLLAHFREEIGKEVSFVIEATDDGEKSAWGKALLNTATSDDAKRMRSLLQQNKSRRNFKSSVLYYESNRAIQNVKPLTFQFDYADPYEEKIGWDFSFHGLANRWQDTQHAIFKKIQSQKMHIANRAIQLQRDGHSSMNLEFSDPLDPFREAFSRLLGPKQLHSADIQNQRLMYSEGEHTREVGSLSSGEREVLTITFDFLLRRPSHCIIFFDEPELHLHPELLARLVSTLRSVGEANQFVLISHSPDIVSSSLNDSVVFLTPAKPDGGNQAVPLTRNDDATEALHRLGHSIGVVSLGKKIVLIEGTDSSLDKQTYSHLLKNRFPSLVLQASGGKGNLQSFSKVAKEVLDKTLWGVRFYMLADRDAAPLDTGSEETANLRILKRYHLENYFLEGEILAKCFSSMENGDSWLRQPDKIEEHLRILARSQIGYATALIESKRIRDLVGNIDVMQKGAHALSKNDLAAKFQQKAKLELDRISSSLGDTDIAQAICTTHDRLTHMLDANDSAWKLFFPGKSIFSIFSAKAGLTEGRLKSLYLLNAEKEEINPFSEIVDIFRDFAQSP